MSLGVVMSTLGQSLGDHSVGSMESGDHGECHEAENWDHGGHCGVGRSWWVLWGRDVGPWGWETGGSEGQSRRHKGHHGTDFEHQGDTIE